LQKVFGFDGFFDGFKILFLGIAGGVFEEEVLAVKVVDL
jgi:hypothetical protein